jgi:mRNA interferase MazF
VSRIIHGGVYWADLGGGYGRRPVVVLTRPEVVDRLTSVTVAPLTRTVRSIITEVPLGVSDGLPTACVVNLDNVQTLPRELLGQRIATLSEARLRDVFRALLAAFAIPATLQ